ncbi:cysteine-rich CWC family protein [Undibacterium luofuense]|uniref:Cysteine-rich CWC family protein n=1 Tax=Undibacterium luofuense TaxID=2828733 RepID=A0A941DNY4_9BURK|nr:cysteine-rich CWC family protein [Undibacterium luofuense]
MNRCRVCDSVFTCGINEVNQPCWCSAVPVIAPEFLPEGNAACLSPACLHDCARTMATVQQQKAAADNRQ